MIDRHSLFFVHGLLLVALGVGMLFPALADWLTRESDAQVFLTSAGITLSVGGLLVAGGQRRNLTLTRKAGFLLTATAYLIVSLFGALPFFFSNLSIPYVDAVFETISGLTTTGATILTGLDTMPPGILLWRAILNWLGGIGVVAMALILMPFLEVGGMQLLRSASQEDAHPSLQGVQKTVTAILTVYIFLTILCLLVYWSNGMSLFDAGVHAMATVSTGGFSSHDDSFAHFDMPVLQWSAVAFMLLGACPYVMFIRMAQGDVLAPLRDSQVRTLIVLAALTAGGLAVGLKGSETIGDEAPLRVIAFNVVSVMTTTGFTAADHSLWGPFASMVFLLIMFIGGCTGSAAGGIKIMRFEIMGRLMILQMRRLLDPHAVVPLRYHRRSVSSTVVLSITVFVFLYTACVFGIAAVLALIGVDPLSSLTGAAAAVGNAGPALGPLIGPSGTYAALPDAAKIMLALGMLLGRLEFLTVLVLFTASFWRS